MVLETQQWLNKTYGGITGYDKAPEDGHTGWPTIYSLREGLQHELGLTSLASGFGDATKNALAGKIGSIGVGSSGNIVKLIKGAFWCKGINPNNFNSKYDSYLDSAVKELQSDAGLTANGTLTVNLMAALFDMSAFVLLSSGDKRVREIQQSLNSQYSNELGVLPCDGIYQRDTNEALIYALQRAEGMSADTANGNYGPGTINATPTVNPGAQGAIVKIIQYGLYVNGFYTGAFDGSFGSAVSSAIVDFRKFMNLPPFTSTADLTVIKGLLTSNGNTNRDSNTFDTATQLTAAQAKMLKGYGFDIVGRYLTGSVGTGASRKNKNLTKTEIKDLTDNGLSIFPIYEDGGYEEDYFGHSQGYQDGITAVRAARKLGFPSNATLYFAVDVDIQDGDIDGTVVPYFKGIYQYMSNTEYKIGVYGTRNVCLHVSKYVDNSFVADMSYGWSGNLGFRMPKNWSFDQFVEYGVGGVDIDQVASSGRDNGSTKFSSSYSFVSASDALKELFGNYNLTLDHTVEIYDSSVLELTATASSGTQIAGGSGAIAITKDGMSSADLGDWISSNTDLPKSSVDILINKSGLASAFTKIKEGNVTIKSSVNSDKSYSVSIALDVMKTDLGYLENTLSVEFEGKVKINDFPNIDPKTVLVVVGIAVLAVILTGGIATAGEGILAMVQGLMTILA